MPNLSAFLRALPDPSVALPKDDFAAQLQWEAWQNHSHHLEAELQIAIEKEQMDGRNEAALIAVSRSSSEVKAQLDAFVSVLPLETTTQPNEDFAARLQREAWQNHKRQLETELEAAIKEEQMDGRNEAAGYPLPRSSSEVEAQLDAFVGVLPLETTAPPNEDFAARLQREAWRNHIRQLEAELEAANKKGATGWQERICGHSIPFILRS